MPVVFEVEVDPYLQARRARHMQGSIAIAKFERLVETLQRDDGEVEVDIEFSRGLGGKPQFKLALNATLVAECQRCLGEVCYPINSERTMLVVNDEAALEKVPEEFEPVLVEEDKLSLMSIIEDELLLSLPIMVKHDDCQMAIAVDDNDDEELEERVNPFAILSQLKTKD